MTCPLCHVGIAAGAHGSGVCSGAAGRLADPLKRAAGRYGMAKAGSPLEAQRRAELLALARQVLAEEPQRGAA